MVVRLFVLQAHYRSPIDFTDEAIAAAENGWNTLAEALRSAARFAQFPEWDQEQTPEQDAIGRFNAAMDDDFNTPVALSVLFELAKELRREENVLVHTGNPEKAIAQLHSLWYTLQELMQVLGLQTLQVISLSLPEAGGQGLPLQISIADSEIEVLIQQRQEARKAKNWAESDRIRDELQSHGITLIDDKGGITRWHRN